MIDINGNYTPDEVAYACYGEHWKEMRNIARYAGRLYEKAERERIEEGSGVREQYGNATLNAFSVENPFQRKTKAMVGQYIKALPAMLKGEPGKRGLFLHGSMGTGKTLLASAVCNAMTKQGIECVFTSVADILDEVKATFDKEGSEQEVMARYKTVPVLVLDDIGKEKATAWMVSQLFRLIDYRYATGKATITTANHDPDLLIDRLTPSDDKYDKTTAEAIVSRLIGSSVVLPMYWRDYRKED